MSGVLVLAANEQVPDDVGKAGPLGLLLIVLLLIATVLLVRSMSTHIKKVPKSFDPEDRVEVPDTPAELIDPPAPGDELLDTLRRAPRAIEPPRAPRSDDDGRPDAGR